MHPILLDLGFIKIYTYGVMVSIAMVVAFLLSSYLAKKEGLDSNKIENIFIFIVLGSIVGARLAYVIEHPNEIGNFLNIFAIWQGGLDWFGGFIGGLLTGIFFLIKYKLPVWKVGDITAIILPIGQAVGRIGCTSAGCCYGKEVPGVTDLSVGIHLMDKFPYFYMVFPEGAIAPPGVPLYPTELMDLIFNVFIFIFLIMLYKKRHFDGEIFSIYLIMAGFFRFVEEFYRGVTPPLPYIGLTWNQIVCIVMMIGGIYLLFSLRSQKLLKSTN